MVFTRKGERGGWSGDVIWNPDHDQKITIGSDDKPITIDQIITAFEMVSMRKPHGIYKYKFKGIDDLIPYNLCCEQSFSYTLEEKTVLGFNFLIKY